MQKISMVWEVIWMWLSFFKHSDCPPHACILKHSPDCLPVPVEALVYAQEEYSRLLELNNRFSRVFRAVIWLEWEGDRHHIQNASKTVYLHTA